MLLVWLVLIIKDVIIMFMFYFVIIIITIIVDNTVLEGSQGVPRNGGRKQQLVWWCFTLSCLHAQTFIMFEPPSLGPP